MLSRSVQSARRIIVKSEQWQKGEKQQATSHRTSGQMVDRVEYVSMNGVRACTRSRSRDEIGKAKVKRLEEASVLNKKR